MPSESMFAATEIPIEEHLKSTDLPAVQTPFEFSVAQADLVQLRLYLQSVRQQVERFEQWFDASLHPTLSQASDAEANKGSLESRVDKLLSGLDRIERLLIQPAAGSLPTLNEPQETDAAEPADAITTIDPQSLFGRELIDDIRARDALVELLRRLSESDPKAVGLVGQLLIWRAVSRERIPKLLGEVGDAYYACFPRTNDQIAPLEQTLVEILGKKCTDCDVPNGIELIRLGERFDPVRHRCRAGERGVEVTEIFGWVVVGTDGQILNRALVGVR